MNGWTLDSFNKMTDSAFVGRFLTEQKPNRRSVTFIPVEGIPALKEPGVPIAVMSQPNRFRGEYQTTYYYVSDFGLHVRQYAGKGADAFVSSLTTGKGRRRRRDLVARGRRQDPRPRRNRWRRPRQLRRAAEGCQGRGGEEG